VSCIKSPKLSRNFQRTVTATCVIKSLLFPVVDDEFWVTVDKLTTEPREIPSLIFYTDSLTDGSQRKPKSVSNLK